MKPIERIAMYLNFKSISPHSFERNINLSNGYYSKQLKNLGSVGSDILIKIYNHFPDLNILWILTGEGQMILENQSDFSESQVDEYVVRYETENKKLKSLETDLEKLQIVLKDKEKIIGLYEFMLNGSNHKSTVLDAR
jgi:hypothetical protein